MSNDEREDGAKAQPLLPQDEEEARLQPYVNGYVDRAVEPFLNVLKPEQIAAMRESLETALLTHPVLRAKLMRVVPAKTVDQSGTVADPLVAPSVAKQDKSAEMKGKKRGR
jgi:hypothetical protein